MSSVRHIWYSIVGDPFSLRLFAKEFSVSRYRYHAVGLPFFQTSWTIPLTRTRWSFGTLFSYLILRPFCYYSILPLKIVWNLILPPFFPEENCIQKKKKMKSISYEEFDFDGSSFEVGNGSCLGARFHNGVSSSVIRLNWWRNTKNFQRKRNCYHSPDYYFPFMGAHVSTTGVFVSLITLLVSILWGPDVISWCTISFHF